MTSETLVAGGVSVKRLLNSNRKVLRWRWRPQTSRNYVTHFGKYMHKYRWLAELVYNKNWDHHWTSLLYSIVWQNARMYGKYESRWDQAKLHVYRPTVGLPLHKPYSAQRSLLLVNSGCIAASRACFSRAAKWGITGMPYHIAPVWIKLIRPQCGNEPCSYCIQLRGEQQ